jgi:predicted nucleic acid-binding Zn ribbon protein
MANRQQRKKRLFILLIFGMAIIPFLVALFLNGKAPFIQGKTNKGQLITPVIPTERNDLAGLDAFSADNIGELPGHWVMLNVVPQEDCNTVCLDAIHKTKQLRLMLNKDLTRTRRAVVFFTDIKPETANQWLQDDNVLLKVKPSAKLRTKIHKIRNGTIPDGLLLLMDPLGNLMMQYEPGFDPYKVKSDLMHLLRISQIG